MFIYTLIFHKVNFFRKDQIKIWSQNWSTHDTKNNLAKQRELWTHCLVHHTCNSQTLNIIRKHLITITPWKGAGGGRVYRTSSCGTVAPSRAEVTSMSYSVPTWNKHYVAQTFLSPAKCNSHLYMVSWRCLCNSNPRIDNKSESREKIIWKIRQFNIMLPLVVVHRFDLLVQLSLLQYACLVQVHQCERPAVQTDSQIDPWYLRSVCQANKFE